MSSQTTIVNKEIWRALETRAPGSFSSRNLMLYPTTVRMQCQNARQFYRAPRHVDCAMTRRIASHVAKRPPVWLV